MKRIIVSILGLILLVSVGYAYPSQQNNQNNNVQKGEVCGEDKSQTRMEKLLTDLTDAQKTKLKDIAIEFRAKKAPIKQQLSEKKEVLSKMVDDPSASQDIINKKIDEISVLKATLAKLRFEQKMRCDVVLTQEQQNILKAHKEDMKRRKGDVQYRGHEHSDM